MGKLQTVKRPLKPFKTQSISGEAERQRKLGWSILMLAPLIGDILDRKAESTTRESAKVRVNEIVESLTKNYLEQEVIEELEYLGEVTKISDRRYRQLEKLLTGSFQKLFDSKNIETL